ncbi:MAG: hypothetical protein AAF206_07125 [Bacteroidota bacterium]
MPQINTYSARLNGGPHGAPGKLRGHIHLFGANNKMIGIIYFHETGTNVPTDTNDGLLHMHLPIAQYTATVDLLRNEDPVYIKYVGNSLGNDPFVFLYTNQEPVGEGE